jgi:flagellar biosynthesis/type III secretory pathway M-ring protein FliF/YscJ
MAEEELIEEDLVEDVLASEVTESPASESKSKNQLPILIGGVSVLIILIVGFLFFTNDSPKKKRHSSNSSVMIEKEEIKKKKKKKKKIKYVKLFSQLDGSDTSKILKELSIEGIQFSTIQTGQKFTVQVDENQVEEARNLLAIKSLPSGSLKQGYELLDDAQTLGVTEFDKRIRFLRALSGRLENVIGELDMIESAKVQIVLPEQRLFTVTQPPVTSSIIVRVDDGAQLSDQIVFSIIQLVSNSVENLQPENVSVIDTSGNLLSDGLFSRIAAKRAGLVDEEPDTTSITPQISREEAIGSPIIPNYDRIQEWFDIKWNYENELKEKTFRQLLGVMPIGAFKVELTSDLGPLENGNIVDVKRQTISVVVDGLNEDIFVDQAFKQQVFATVAGAVGYVRGRDSIQLSVAEFPLYTDTELKKLKSKYTGINVLGYIGYILLAGLLGGGGFFGYNFIKSRIAEKKEEKEIDLRDNLENMDEIEDLVIDNQPKIDEIKEISSTSPKSLATLIENWLAEDVSDEEVNEEEKTLVEELS